MNLPVWKQGPTHAVGLRKVDSNIELDDFTVMVGSTRKSTRKSRAPDFVEPLHIVHRKPSEVKSTNVDSLDDLTTNEVDEDGLPTASNYTLQDQYKSMQKQHLSPAAPTGVMNDTNDDINSSISLNPVSTRLQGSS